MLKRFTQEDQILPVIEVVRTRRDFVLRSAAFSLAAMIPQGLAAQQPISNRSREPEPQPAVIPRDTRLKFNPDGSRRRFAGNTVVCHLPQQSDFRDAVKSTGDMLRSSSFAAKLAILPSESYHATILGGLNDIERDPSEWPGDMPIGTSITECNRILQERFEHFKMRERLPIRFRLDQEKTLAPQLASGLQLVPADPREKLKLSRLRDHLADEVFRYRAKNHSTFGFHISLAYQLSGFTSEERREYQGILQDQLPRIFEAAPVIELGVPEFCTFNDMDRFDIRMLIHT